MQGVGPKAGLSVLDVLTPHQLAQAVAHDDKTAIGRANGVGAKLAQRIAIELKGKALSHIAFEPVSYKPAEAARPTVSGEAVAALLGLGIAENPARLAVDVAARQLGPEAELPVLIRTALKSLGK